MRGLIRWLLTSIIYLPQLINQTLKRKIINALSFDKLDGFWLVSILVIVVYGTISAINAISAMKITLVKGCAS